MNKTKNQNTDKSRNRTRKDNTTGVSRKGMEQASTSFWFYPVY